MMANWVKLQVRGNIFSSYRCTKCNGINDYANFKYCPNCGSRMSKTITQNGSTKT